MSTSNSDSTKKAHDGVVAKVVGADVEFANFFIDERSSAESRDYVAGTAGDAARLLLANIEGCSSGQGGSSLIISPGGYVYSFGYAAAPYGRYDDDWPDSRESGCALPGYREHAQDRGRKFLPTNGFSAYIDMEHLELCTCEVTSAFDHVAAWHAMMRIARDAMHRTNAELPPVKKVKVLATNTGGQDKSWGSHLSVLVTRRCYDDLFNRKMHYLQWLASCQCASLILTGGGKVGSENGHSQVPYNISARADYFETMAGPQTTIQRPLCNTRNEALADDSGLARVHIIFFDSTLCHTSILLRTGIMQIVLAMIEQGQVPMCLLDDPLDAVNCWSRDPELRARAGMASGERYTAVDLLENVFEHAQRFVAAGRAEGLVPRVAEIMTRWGECLQAFRRGDIESLATKLDWVAKRSMLRRAVERRGVAWNAPLIKYLDQLYASVDPSEGLYFALERAGAVERVVSDGEIEKFVNQPAEDTRAWLRAAILRRAAPGTIDHVNWDTLRLRTAHTSRHGWTDYSYQTLPMKNPLGFTRAECESILADAPSLSQAVAQLIHMQTAGPAASTELVAPELCAAPVNVPSAGECTTVSNPSFQGD